MNGVPEAGFLGAVLVINLLGELIKKTPLDDMLRSWLPVVLEAAGFLVGMLLGFGWFASLFVGFSAMGLYSGVKYTAGTVRELKK
jgi:hypothetical protein